MKSPDSNGKKQTPPRDINRCNKSIMFRKLHQQMHPPEIQTSRFNQQLRKQTSISNSNSIPRFETRVSNVESQQQIPADTNPESHEVPAIRLNQFQEKSSRHPPRPKNINIQQVKISSRHQHTAIALSAFIDPQNLPTPASSNHKISASKNMHRPRNQKGPEFIQRYTTELGA